MNHFSHSKLSQTLFYVTCGAYILFTMSLLKNEKRFRELRSFATSPSTATLSLDAMELKLALASEFPELRSHLLSSSDSWDAFDKKVEKFIADSRVHSRKVNEQLDHYLAPDRKWSLRFFWAYMVSFCYMMISGLLDRRNEKDKSPGEVPPPYEGASI